MTTTVRCETTTLADEEMQRLRELAAQLRVDSVRASTAAGSGHPSSSLSAADLMAVLMARHLRYDWDNPDSPLNDHLIFSKGHASPLLYSMFKAAGVISDEELMNGYRRFGNWLQGHPTPALPWVDVATGSLGQGLPIAVGVALAAQCLDQLPLHLWVLCGDSEMAEGSMWEAIDKAGYYRLRNLTAIVDVNRLGQRGPTELEWDMDAYRRRFEAFDWHAVVIDGHDLHAIDEAYRQVRGIDRPTAILARTIKGKGLPQVENEASWHGKALPPDLAEKAVAELGGVRNLRVRGPLPEPGTPAGAATAGGQVTLPTYKKGDKVATRKAFGDALVALGARTDVVVLDAEVGNSTHTLDFAEKYPDRFFQMFIAEQQMVAAAVGLQVRGYRPWAATFAAFFTRAHDFIRMAAVSQADIYLAGSHVGVEIGPDGPSQMGLEDISMMRAILGSTVLYPSDAVSCAALVTQMVDREGVNYIRTTRGSYPVLYDNGESFPVGGSKQVRGSDSDDVALLGAGVTLHNCLAAADLLADAGIRARVLDLYSVKPIDREAVREAARATGGRVIVVEDHYPEGGLGEAVLSALSEQAVPVTHLAVRTLPASGNPDELLKAAGIDAIAIAETARSVAGR
ncbi:transketolase [Planosporangium flavigriseum]|uniref:Transketolase n=1 Tax=Planosporangium flavigriseum TaxID=373681 RepID=A0A8J3PLC3_9ACTN|nr:transketolase [Planosporangium flavigriseum]NJC65110.1 transketolase [Planosporangium flavigriseum]GIG71726.1 transketolase [Planosporangium flavigriseum]